MRESGKECKKPTACKPNKTEVFRIFIEHNLPLHTSLLSKYRTSTAELRFIMSLRYILLYLQPDRLH